MEEEIELLRGWDFPSTVSVPDGYDWKQVPEATSSNMVVLMDKINELIEEINKLKSK